VNGYVEEQYANPGDMVSASGELFRLRTRESASLQSDSSGLPGFSGIIRIRASLSGVVNSIDHPKGDYVQEGDLLASIVLPSSLVYILEAPYESAGIVRTGDRCNLILPDGTAVPAHVRSLLPSMNSNAQTKRFVVQPDLTRNDPENLVARVRFARKVNPNAVSLPKACILSDEIQQHFWVMRLINDSIAVRMDITPGLQSGGRVEIASPVTGPGDRFVASGNYGLGDTARVVITGTYKNP
jgi:multidrug efflux pump subunit AcrA (membrane-fusion protein)